MPTATSQTCQYTRPMPATRQANATPKGQSLPGLKNPTSPAPSDISASGSSSGRASIRRATRKKYSVHMPVNRPDSTSATVPIHSTPWPAARVQKAYTMAARYRNPEISPNSRNSAFMVMSSARGTGRAVGVERLRRRRVRLRVTGRAQRVRRTHALLLGRDEPLVLVERHRAQLEVHHRVVRAAQLRAPPDVRALPLDGDREGVLHVAREHVPLEQQLRYPERVNDVLRLLHEPDRLVRRQHEYRHVVAVADGGPRLLVRALHVAVAELPVPLERDHVDGHVRVDRLLVHAGLHDRGVVEQHRDDQERDHRVEQLNRQVLPGLRGQPSTPLAVPDDAPEDQAPHEDADDQGGHRRADPDVVHVPGPVADALVGPPERDRALDP